jgi:hypothetical protein
MRKFFLFLSAAGIFLYACSSSTKATGSSTNSLVPGDAELKAIQVKYPDVNMQMLNDGYAIYTGPCTKCHRQKKLFKRTEEEWLKSVDKMAPKSKISLSQKDALWKYILAMRAARPSPTK